MIVYIKNNELYNGNSIQTEKGLIFNPSEEQLLSNGYVKEENNELDDFQGVSPIEDIRRQILTEAENYYNSKSVSAFYFNDELCWVSTSDRVTFKAHLESYVESGNTGYVEYNGKPVDPVKALEFLNKLNCYAVEIHNVFSKHIQNIESIVDSSVLSEYDYTAKYPDLLTFD